MGGRVVVVEDDPAISYLLRMYLEAAGFGVEVADDGRRGLAAAMLPGTDLALVDLGLPGDLDGLEVCRRLRAETDVALVILTARRDEDDRVLGLDLGADDYVTKPFSPRELLARIRAVLRRRGDRPPSGPLQVGEVAIDVARREVTTGGDTVALTTREFDLLAYLARHLGEVVGRQQILDGAWGPGWFGTDRTVDVHVRQLRVKLPDLPLATVRGSGYRLG